MENYRKYAMLMCSMGLMFLVVGITYAFFNYTRTGNPNNFSVGRISFESKNEQTITINNLFPIDPNDSNSLNDPTKVGTYQIAITGDTDYDDGLEYLVSIVDSNITTSTGKTIPIGINLQTTGLGNNENNYLSLRKTTTTPINMKMIDDYIDGDSDILVGFIPTNIEKGTISGVNGSITIKAYIDKNKVAISDTYNTNPTPSPSNNNGNDPEYIYNVNATNEDIANCVYHLINDLSFPGDATLTESYCRNENTQYGRLSDSFSGFPSQIKDVLIGDNIFIDANAVSNNSYADGTTSAWVNGRVVLTTSEWDEISNTGISFKVKVEANKGIWYMKSLGAIMKKDAVLDNTRSTFVSSSSGIYFSNISSDTNGKGIYMSAGTENDTYPIYYYRGNVDNNVLFANKCWKIVRTTETGGTKLIYNGNPEPLMNYLEESDYNVTSNYNLTYNSQTSSWENITSNSEINLEFTLEAANDYVLYLESNVASGISSYIYVYKNGTQIYYSDASAQYAVIHFSDFGSITANDTIKIYCYDIGSNSQYPSMYRFKMYHSSDDPIGIRCDNMGKDTGISLNVSNALTNNFKFNENKTSPAYNGYMYGTVYNYSTTGWVSGRKYGSGFTYNGSTYQLTDPVSSVNATHHYSCNLTDAEGRCEEIRYQFSSNGGYIVLTGGDGIEEAMAKMQTNTNSSIAKQMLDSWYETNLSSYTNKLEDTIWCNDRSVATNNNGWISNGGDLSTNLQYGSYARSGFSSFRSPLPSRLNLTCPNKNDRFTVSNSEGNEALTYPVGLLTQEEYALAGAITSGTNINYYLYNGYNTWLMSPLDFYSNKSQNIYMFTNGSLGYNATNLEFALRPSISLNKDQSIGSGTGTALDPYVIE